MRPFSFVMALDVATLLVPIAAFWEGFSYPIIAHLAKPHRYDPGCFTDPAGALGAGRTGGAGGLVQELARGEISVLPAYLLLVALGLGLTWSADVFSIISFASCALAACHARQSALAAPRAQKGKAPLFWTIAVFLGAQLPCPEPAPPKAGHRKCSLRVSVYGLTIRR